MPKRIIKNQGYFQLREHPFFLIFFIKHGLIAIRPKNQTFRPGRRPSHLLTYHIKVNAHAALDDQLIMDMSADKAMPQRLHREHQDIPTVGSDPMNVSVPSSPPRFLQEVPLPCISQSKKEGLFKPPGRKISKKTRPRKKSFFPSLISFHIFCCS